MTLYLTNDYLVLQKGVEAKCDRCSMSGDNAFWVFHGVHLIRATIRLMMARQIPASALAMLELMDLDVLCRSLHDEDVPIAVRSRIRKVLCRIPGMPADPSILLKAGIPQRSIRRYFQSLTQIAKVLSDIPVHRRRQSPSQASLQPEQVA